MIDISMEGYNTYSRDISVFCDPELACSECMPRLDLELMENFCNRTVKISVLVTDTEDNPIVGASVTIEIKWTKVGFQNILLEEPHHGNLTTNSSGMTEEVIPEFGVYTIQVSAKGFLPASKDVEVSDLLVKQIFCLLLVKLIVANTPIYGKMELILGLQYPLLKYNIISEDFYHLMAAVYIYLLCTISLSIHKKNISH